MHTNHKTHKFTHNRNTHTDTVTDICSLKLGGEGIKTENLHDQTYGIRGSPQLIVTPTLCPSS